MIKKIIPFGDQAVLCDFGEEVTKEINNNVICVFKIIQQKIFKHEIVGIKNCVPSYNKLLINYDLKKISLLEIINFIENTNFSKEVISQHSKSWKLPICYDEEFGIDQENVSKSTGLSINEVLDLHQKTSFYIYMIGFMPGLPYMGDLNNSLYVPRLETPRVEIAEGSVIIAEKFCCIFPRKNPCGWSILGRTPVKLFDQTNQNNPSLLSPGDTVNFYKITKSNFFNFDNRNLYH
jgi:inhibitor of KinA